MFYNYVIYVDSYRFGFKQKGQLQYLNSELVLANLTK